MSNDIPISLVSKAVSGDREALEQLFLSQQKSIAVTIRRMTTCQQDVDDISQEVAICLYRYISSLKRPETFGAWLHKLVIRECVRYFNLHNPNNTIADESVDAFENLFTENYVDYIPFAYAERLELYTEIQTTLGNMPEILRKVIVLYSLEEMPYQEIANHLGLPVGTVCAYMYRARTQLRRKLRRK